MRLRGEAIGAEFRGKGIDVMLGPVAGALGRTPQGGRYWEGFGLVSLCLSLSPFPSLMLSVPLFLMADVFTALTRILLVLPWPSPFKASRAVE